MKRVAILVLTHNGKRNLKECFDSINEQSFTDFDLYLIDNGSTDGTSEYVEKNFPMVRVIRFERNFGFAGGYNKAVDVITKKYGEYEYLVFLNDDTKVDKKWYIKI